MMPNWLKMIKVTEAVLHVLASDRRLWSPSDVIPSVSTELGFQVHDYEIYDSFMRLAGRGLLRYDDDQVAIIPTNLKEYHAHPSFSRVN